MNKRRDYPGKRRRYNNKPSGNNNPGNSNDNNKNRRYPNPGRGTPQAILPPPAILQEYEYATDGAADRILKMAEIEQQRRNDWEDEYLRSHRKSMRIGQLFGSLLLLATVATIYSLAMNGRVDVAEILAGASFLSVALANFFNKPWRTKPGRKPRR